MNKKTLFLVITLVAMLILVTSVNATTDNTNTSTTHSISEKTTTTEPVVKEKIEKTQIKEKTDKIQTKQITKTNKTRENTKKDSITIDGIEYTTVIENQEYGGLSIEDSTFFNNCTINSIYGFVEIYSNIYINNSLVNLESVSAYCEQITINNSIINEENEGYWEGQTYIISNSTINAYTFIYTQGNNKITNSTLNNILFLSENTETTFSDDTIFGENFELQGEGSYKINDTSRITPYITTFYGNTTLTNYNLSRTIYNSGNLTFISSTLNSTISNSGIVYISDDTIIGENFSIINYGQAKVIINDTTKIGIYEGNIEITNKNITKDITIPITGNITFTGCNITAQITNYGNLSLVNCSLSNNDLSLTGVGYRLTVDGFFVNNMGNFSLVDCYIENNTFSGSGNVVAGAILNNETGVLSLVNTSFKNNSIGVVSDARLNLIRNYGIVDCWDNSSFIGNSLKSFSHNSIVEFTLNVTNSLFENNTEKVFDVSYMHIINSTFTDNKFVYLGSGVAGGLSWDDYGMAITAGSLFVDNCTFDGNGIISKDQYTFVGGYGGAISATNLFVNNSVFRNNVVNTTTTWNADSGTGAAIRMTTGEVYNSVFENNYASNPSSATIPTIGKTTYGGMSIEGCLPGSGADIYSTDNVVIQNNTFTDSYASNQASSIYAYVYSYPGGQNNITIVNNTFNQCKSSLDTIVIEHNGITNITLADNVYQNTTINDEIILDIPSQICVGEEINISGTYNILNTSFYDENILEQNKFNIYINGELDQTVDELDFTITPTSDNMILTVQPNISSTRKSVIIRPITINFTLEDVTATIGETTQLTTQITATTDGENMEVNTGRVYFKVNGKILRDTTNGRILYADVSDNTATLDYNVPKAWNEDTEIEAVFTGNDEIPQKASNTVNPTITAQETSQPEFSVADTTATAGEEVTITVTTKNLDNGKVVLKVNGKTVKADDGKLYTKVEGDSVTFTYTVPKTLKAGDYMIKAVYTSGATKQESEATLTVE